MSNKALVAAALRLNTVTADAFNLSSARWAVIAAVQACAKDDQKKVRDAFVMGYALAYLAKPSRKAKLGKDFINTREANAAALAKLAEMNTARNPNAILAMGAATSAWKDILAAANVTSAAPNATGRVPKPSGAKMSPAKQVQAAKTETSAAIASKLVRDGVLPPKEDMDEAASNKWFFMNAKFARSMAKGKGVAADVTIRTAAEKYASAVIKAYEAKK